MTLNTQSQSLQMHKRQAVAEEVIEGMVATYVHREDAAAEVAEDLLDGIQEMVAVNQGPPLAIVPRSPYVRTETPPQSVQYNTCRLHADNSVQMYPSHSQVKIKKLAGL